MDIENPDGRSNPDAAPPGLAARLKDRAAALLQHAQAWWGSMQAAARRPVLDILIALLVMLCAMTAATGYLTATGYDHHYHRDWFGPAAMMAEGYGMVNPELGKMKALNAFIAGTAETWNPAEDRNQVAFKELHWFQRDHPNLIRAVALFWYLFGYSWQVLIALHALFFGVTCAFAYGLCRMAMPRLIALPVTAAFMISPAHLAMIPEIRDYSKAPFLLAALFVCAWIVRSPRRVPALLATVALLGLFVGMGLGFRLDMTLCIPPVLLTCLGFLPYPWKRSAVLGFAASLLFLAAVYTGGRESIASMRENGSTGTHNIAGGLYWQFDTDMGVNPSYYSNLFVFNDHYIFETISSHHRRTAQEDTNFGWLGAPYYTAAASYLKDVWTRYPADLLTRAFASTFEMLETAPADIQGEFAINPLLVRTTRFMALPLIVLADFGRWIALLALVILIACRLRLGLFVLLALLYFAGSPSLQYMPRHYFYLSLAPWFFTGLLAALGCHGLGVLLLGESRTAFLQAARSWAFWRLPLARVGGVALVFAVVILIPWAILRGVQTKSVLAYNSGIAAATLAPLSYDAEPTDKGTLLRCAELPKSEAETRAGMADAYLVAEFEGPPGAFQFGVRYEAVSNFQAFEHKIPVRLSEAGVVRIYFPIYERTKPQQLRRTFIGIELDKQTVPFLKGLYTVQDAGKFPLWPTIFLNPEWERFPQCLSFSGGHSAYTKAMRLAVPELTN